MSRCGFVPWRSVTAASHPSPVGVVVSPTVVGKRMGLVNETSAVYVAGSRASSAASALAWVHMPWMIGRGNPKARAAILLV